MVKNKKLSESMEDYLETIYNLIEKDRVARVKDIAEKMGVRKASVTGALHVLAEKGLVNYEPYKFVTLTDNGIQMAMSVVKRHEALCSFFIDILSIDRALAEENACKIEHSISGEVLERLVTFGEFLKVCPQVRRLWRDENKTILEEIENNKDCKKCKSSVK